MNSSNIVIGVPYKIGCGLAGGNWDKYHDMLLSFSNKIDCKVKVYKIENMIK